MDSYFDCSLCRAAICGRKRYETVYAATSLFGVSLTYEMTYDLGDFTSSLPKDNISFVLQIDCSQLFYSLRG